MLILEPRASDDETPESEASIGTADSSENITMETEGATSEPSGECVFERYTASCHKLNEFYISGSIITRHRKAHEHKWILTELRVIAGVGYN